MNSKREQRLTKTAIGLTIFISVVIVFLMSVITIGILNHLRRRQMDTSFSVNDITPSSSLVDHSLTIMRGHEILRFESIEGNSQVGSSDTYMFSSRDHASNTMKITFSVNIYVLMETRFSVTLCDDNGDNERLLTLQETLSNNTSGVIFTSSSDLFVKKVDIEYIAVI